MLENPFARLQQPAGLTVNEVVDELECYLVFDYLYCDAGNYKIFGSILFSGTLTDAERNELIDCLDSGKFFVAEQVGVPPLCSALFEEFDGPTEDDHAWHMFDGFREESGLIEGAKVC